MFLDALASAIRTEVSSFTSDEGILREFDIHVLHGDYLTAIEIAYNSLRADGFRLPSYLYSSVVKHLSEYLDDEEYSDVFEYEQITYDRLLSDGSAPVAA